MAFTRPRSVRWSDGSPRAVRELIKLWETATGREVRTLRPNTGFINTIAFSPDGTLLAGGGLSGTITLWESSSGRNVRSLVGHSDSVNSIVFSRMVALWRSPVATTR